MPRYAELIYNGFWFSPEREMLQALIDKSQEHVTGTVRVKLYKGIGPHRGALVGAFAVFREACDLRGGRRRL
jgi:argininosuccinate synthase